MTTRHRLTGAAAALTAAAALLASCTSTEGSTARDPRSDTAGGSATGSPSPAAPPDRSFTVVSSGDVLVYPSIARQAQQDAGGDGYDFHAILSAVKPLVSGADLALCHMETVYGPPGGPFSGYPLFQVPPQVAQSLADTGYDSCSTASNHTLDAGTAGVHRTLDALDRAGVRHPGSARTEREAATPVVFDADGVQVAHLSYTYGTNGIPLPDAAPWTVNVIDPDRIVAEARAARRAGAELVLLSLHWGTEWQEAPDAQQLALADRLTASRDPRDGRRDIDLILGTHNHVAQPYEKVNGVWVVYGMGDQVASFIPSLYRGNESSVARFRLRRVAGSWSVDRAEFVPQYSDTGPPFRVVDLDGALAARSGLSPGKRAEYEAVRARIRAAVLSRGAAEDGLREASASDR